MTMTTTGPKQATFCYRCGRRVGKTNETCWYCSAPTSRWIRKPKHCPYCGEEVRAEAVKCRHCGEFIDGRPSTATAAVPQQVVFVVDRNLLQGMRAAQDFQLLAGQPVPPEVARALDAQTVRAIETGQPRLIAQPGVRALPAPAASAAEADVIDAEPIGRNPAGAALIPRPPGAAAQSTSANLPARRGETAPATAGSAALQAGKALVKAGGWLARKALAPAPQSQPAASRDVDAEAHDLYRTCVRCQTEILTQDNYCFHCGYQYHTPKHEQVAQALRRRRPRTGQFLAASLLITAYLVLRILNVPLPRPELAGPALPALPALAALISLVGLVRGRGFINRAVSLALAAAAAAAWWFFQ